MGWRQGVGAIVIHSISFQKVTWESRTEGNIRESHGVGVLKEHLDGKQQVPVSQRGACLRLRINQNYHGSSGWVTQRLIGHSKVLGLDPTGNRYQ